VCNGIQVSFVLEDSLAVTVAGCQIFEKRASMLESNEWKKNEAVDSST
jgi:hypothetical protein